MSSELALKGLLTFLYAVRLRMLLFYNYIVLDPAFFGPNIASNAEVWSLRQLHRLFESQRSAK